MKLLLAATVVILPVAAVAQSVEADEAAADRAARAALPRAEVRSVMTEVRSIQGLQGNIAGSGRAISGTIVGIAAAQRSLASDGLSAQMVNGALEVSLPGDVLFDFDKATIRQNAVATLEKIKTAATATGDRPVTVEGHTDSLGTTPHNQALSEARARAVADWLANAGIAKSRLTSRGFGATRPIAPNASASGTDDPAGRQRNRRVTILL